MTCPSRYSLDGFQLSGFDATAFCYVNVDALAAFDLDPQGGLALQCGSFSMVALTNWSPSGSLPLSPASCQVVTVGNSLDLLCRQTRSLAPAGSSQHSGCPSLGKEEQNWLYSS